MFEAEQSAAADFDPDKVTLDQFLHKCLEDPPIIRFITMIEKLDVARECTSGIDRGLRGRGRGLRRRGGGGGGACEGGGGACEGCLLADIPPPTLS